MHLPFLGDALSPCLPHDGVIWNCRPHNIPLCAAFSQGVCHSKSNETRVALTQQGDSKLKYRGRPVMWIVCYGGLLAQELGHREQCQWILAMPCLSWGCGVTFTPNRLITIFFLFLNLKTCFSIYLYLNSVYFRSWVLFLFLPLYLSVGLVLDQREVILKPCWDSWDSSDLLRLSDVCPALRELLILSEGWELDVWVLFLLTRLSLETHTTTGFIITIAVLLCPREVRQWIQMGTRSCPRCHYPWLNLDIWNSLSYFHFWSWARLCVCSRNENDV